MGSVIVGIIVVAIIAAIVLSMRSDRKKGKHSCGGYLRRLSERLQLSQRHTKTQTEILKITKPLHKGKQEQPGIWLLLLFVL